MAHADVSRARVIPVTAWTAFGGILCFAAFTLGSLGVDYRGGGINWADSFSDWFSGSTQSGTPTHVTDRPTVDPIPTPSPLPTPGPPGG